MGLEGATTIPSLPQRKRKSTSRISDSSSSPNRFNNSPHFMLTISFNNDLQTATFDKCLCSRCQILALSNEHDQSYSSDDDTFDDYRANECLERFLLEEEEYEFKTRSKASLRTGRMGARPKHTRRTHRTLQDSRARSDRRAKAQEVERRERRRQCRAEEQQAQLEARKQWRSDCFQAPSLYDCDNFSNNYVGNEGDFMLSPEELGIESPEMYDRLLQIVSGGDITPEDFDLLLSLDTNNAKKTMKTGEISKLELLVLGDKNENNHEQLPEGKVLVTKEDLGKGDTCLICLQHFNELENGFELRRLPCRHVFCRECIDQWLQQVSSKCPDLSCFWEMDNIVDSP